MAQQQHSAQETAQALVASPKGLLAVDETPRTLTSRFDALGIESTAESRRDYRELLFRAAGIDAHISGAILNDETLRQQAADSTPIAQVLIQRGIMPGVKVDTGIHPLAAAPNEGITEGLDGLRPRLNEYREMGVRFCKWRAVYTIGPGTPSRTSIAANNHALARYAALCQEAGLAPVVESEVLLDGNHSIEQCYHATETVLLDLFSQCAMQRVLPEGLLLKVNMVISGKDAPQRAERPGGGGAYRDLLAPDRTRGRTGRGVPLRRPERRRGGGQPERYLRPRRVGWGAVAGELLLRPRPTRSTHAGVGRQAGEHYARSGDAAAPGVGDQRGSSGAVPAGVGGGVAQGKRETPGSSHVEPVSPARFLPTDYPVGARLSGPVRGGGLVEGAARLKERN